MNSIKKFIATVAGQDETLKSFLPSNLLALAIVGVTRHDDGSVSFTEVADFSKVINYTLTKEEQVAWDLFNDFRSPKNATNVILHCIDNNIPIDGKIFDKEGKITALRIIGRDEVKKDDKVITEGITPQPEFKKVVNFNDFWALLDEEDRKKVVLLAKNWLKAFHIDSVSFDFFQINDGSYGKGTYVMAYDGTQADTFYTRVLQECPNGFITCVGNDGVFSLSTQTQPQIIDREVVPAKLVDKLDKQYDKFQEDLAIYREDRLGKALKQSERDAKAAEAEAKKAEEKKAKEAEKLAADQGKEKVMNELLALPMDTENQVAVVVGKLNTAGLNKVRKDKVKEAIKAAKAKIKEAAKKAETEAKAKNEPKEDGKADTQPKTPEAKKEGEKATPKKPTRAEQRAKQTA